MDFETFFFSNGCINTSLKFEVGVYLVPEILGEILLVHEVWKISYHSTSRNFVLS